MSQIPHDHPLPVLPVPTSSPPRPTTTSTSATLGSQYAPRDKDYEKHKAYSENGDEDDRDIKDDLGLPRASSVTERGLRLPPLAYGTSNHPHPRDKTPARRGSGLDYIVPLGEEKAEEKPRPHSVTERLKSTITAADTELKKCQNKARMTAYALNIAIGLQVVLGALTTGLSAVTTGRQTSIMTSILGGLSTIVASYLARARGSGEPELSVARSKELEHFLRECRAFDLDHGHVLGTQFDDRIFKFRDRYEALLGNANGHKESKSSPA